MSSGLIVRSSAIHAAGCYTLRPIRKGRRVVEYDGPRMTKKVADARYAERVVTYLFSYGDRGGVIDGFGVAMFINHSCEPNCESLHVGDRVFIVALRDIAAGEELVYSYNLWDADGDPQLCFCGAPKCRGTMLSTDEVKRQVKRSAKETRSKAAR